MSSMLHNGDWVPYVSGVGDLFAMNSGSRKDGNLYFTFAPGCVDAEFRLL